MSEKLEDILIIFLALAIFGSFLLYLNKPLDYTKTLDIKNFESKKILIISPHPDDEIALAGDILVWLEDRKYVYIMYLTNWTKKSFYENFYTYERKREAIKWLKKVWIKNYEFLDFQDYYWDNETLRKVKKQLDEKIKILNPDIIFVPAFEWGHCVHDLTNLLMYNLKNKYKIYESAEYNWYIWFSTPKKLFHYILYWAFEVFSNSIIWTFEFQSDFLPNSISFYSWEKNVILLNSKQKKLKKIWLNTFSTQNIGWAISNKFFNQTVFRIYNWYDYNRPYDIKKSLTYQTCKLLSPRKDCEKIGVCHIDYKDFNEKFKALYWWN